MSDDALKHIQRLVADRPTITVRELARELGFSEEASIYYWLRKAGFKGLKELKGSVFANSAQLRTGQYAHSPVEVAESDAPPYGRLLRVVRTDEYAPWLLLGDRLALEERAEPMDGELIVLQDGNDAEVIRRFFVGPPPILVHPGDARKVTAYQTAESAKIIGCIVTLQRSRP